MSEARFLYDQLAIFAPIMLALTAATPIWKGMLADTDVRWDVISGSVDDRSTGERGTAEPRPGEKRIPKSRYSSIDCFISTSPLMQDAYNDVKVPPPPSDAGWSARRSRVPAGHFLVPAAPRRARLSRGT